jgi:hypothetical protein
MRAIVAEMPAQWLAERKKCGADQWDEMWDGVLHIPPVANRERLELQFGLVTYLLEQWARPRGYQVHHLVNLTTPDDEANWLNNFRISDFIILTPDRFEFDKCDYVSGPPLVVGQIRSPGDESYQKLDFYRELGVPEVWIITRDSKEIDLYVLQADGTYAEHSSGPDAWVRSPATGVELRPTPVGKLALRLNDDATTEEVIPVG